MQREAAIKRAIFGGKENSQRLEEENAKEKTLLTTLPM